MIVPSCSSESQKSEHFSLFQKNYRGVGAEWAGWARAHPLFCLIFSEKEYLPIHFLLPAEWFLVLPTHFEEASDAPGSLEVHILDG